MKLQRNWICLTLQRLCIWLDWIEVLCGRNESRKHKSNHTHINYSIISESHVKVVEMFEADLLYQPQLTVDSPSKLATETPIQLAFCSLWCDNQFIAPHRITHISNCWLPKAKDPDFHFISFCMRLNKLRRLWMP